jgi:hypothetical protein
MGSLATTNDVSWLRLGRLYKCRTRSVVYFEPLWGCGELILGKEEIRGVE